jgi:large subunit ribosomal protein L25
MSINLEVKERDKKENLNELRKSGFIPAILYGHGIANVNLSVPKKEFHSIFKKAGESTIIEISWDKERRPVLINDIQYDYLKEEIGHIDFHQVKLDEKIKAEVELDFVGISPAVKNLGGVLVKNIQKIEVESLPQNLSHSLEVDISKLVDFESVFKVEDLKMPEGVKSLVSDDIVIASVSLPKEEKEEEGEVDISKVEVEGEKKEEEVGEDKEEKGKNKGKEGNKGKNKGK